MLDEATHHNYIAIMNGNVAKFVVIVASIALGVIRCAGYKTALFQAIAHCFTAGIFGYGVGAKKKFYWITALILSAVEVGAFLWFKFFA